jgi:DNA polymerase-1
MNLPRPILVDQPDLHNVFLLDLGCMPMIEKMQRAGIRIDLARLSRVDVLIRDKLGDTLSSIEKTIGSSLFHSTRWKKGVFLPSSGDQVAELLFDCLGVSTKGVKRTKKGSRLQVDSKSLEKLRTRHPVVPLLMLHSELSKLRNAFTRTLPRKVSSDGRIRPDIKTTRTATGRLAFSEPNLQQIPVRSDLGRAIRSCFIPDDGSKFVSVDQSQIEMRVIAHDSQDEALCQIFHDGDDIHWRTAEAIHGKPRDRLDKDKHRAPAKNVSFGIAYGITPEGLYDQIVERITDDDELAEWSVGRCRQLIDAWFDIYPGARDRFNEYHRRAKRHGYIWSMWGRVRVTAGVRSAHSWIREKTLREAGNMPIQEGAQGIMKLAMRDCFPYLETLEDAGIRARAVLQVHDELVVEVEEGVAEEVGLVLQQFVEEPVRIRVPIESGMSVGEDWGALK